MDIKVHYYYAVSGDYFEDRIILENVAADASESTIESFAKETIYQKKRHKNVHILNYIRLETEQEAT